jgi:serine/threonine-protein kinase HipA
MKICPIAYQPCEGKYSEQGLKKLSQKLTRLNDFPYTAEEQIRESTIRSGKMSIQGVQPKLSALLDLKEKTFRVVNTFGRYILKPQHPMYPRLPENEDLTMRLAEASGIEVPFHGLIYCRDGSMTYFIKRFDRGSRKKRHPVEDFAQLLELNRETKYEGSMEKVAGVLDRFSTFPAIDKRSLFRLTLFNFLVGNEDMHLKNFSLLTKSAKVELSPCYDLINTTLVMGQPQEEIALPIQGKKNKLTRKVLVDYFGGERLGLSEKISARVLEELQASLPKWEPLIHTSFLTEEMKAEYQHIIHERADRLF